MTITVAEAIAISDIVINAVLIIGLANYIQKYQVNSRTLKDYFIKEIDKIHLELILFSEKMEDGNVVAQDVQNNFFRLVRKTTALTYLIDNKYKGSNAQQLVQNIVQLQYVVENDSTYIANYRTNNTFDFSPLTIDEIRFFAADSGKVFHELVVKVNNYSKNFL